MEAELGPCTPPKTGGPSRGDCKQAETAKLLETAESDKVVRTPASPSDLC